MIQDLAYTPPCPGCESAQVRHAHRRKLLDFLLAPLAYHPWRCQICRRRFYFSPWLSRRTRRHARRRHAPFLRRFLRWRDKKGALLLRALVLAVFVLAAVYAFFRFLSSAPHMGD